MGAQGAGFSPGAGRGEKLKGRSGGRGGAQSPLGTGLPLGEV